MARPKPKPVPKKNFTIYLRVCEWLGNYARFYTVKAGTTFGELWDRLFPQEDMTNWHIRGGWSTESWQIEQHDVLEHGDDICIVGRRR